MEGAPDYAAIGIEVTTIDDHRQAEFVVESGVDREWTDGQEQRALGARVEALRGLDARGLQPSGPSHPDAEQQPSQLRSRKETAETWG
jgi:hypothetical protein